MDKQTGRHTFHAHTHARTHTQTGRTTRMVGEFLYGDEGWSGGDGSTQAFIPLMPCPPLPVEGGRKVGEGGGGKEGEENIARDKENNRNPKKTGWLASDAGVDRRQVEILRNKKINQCGTT